MGNTPAKDSGAALPAATPSASGARFTTPRPPGVDEAETLVMPGGSKPSLPPSHAPTPLGTTTFTPERALKADEVARSRLFLKICGFMACAVGVGVPFVSGNVWLRASLAGSCAIVLVAVLMFRRVLHDEMLSTPRRWILVSGMLVAASCVGVWVFGVYSPAPMVGTFGIYFLCLGSSMRVAVVAYLAGAVLHFIPAFAIALRLMDDPGILTPAGLPTRDMIVAALMVQVVFVATFFLARGSRAATRDAFEKLHTALLQVQKREALLAEAHLELDQALRAGQRGPYTDRRVGEYVLGDIIGRGAMGDVYEARGDGTGAAAVKVLHLHLLTDGAHKERFLREAQIIARLASPHVVRFLGMDADSQPPYIAMELLQGRDLAWHLRREGRFSVSRVMELVEHVADALVAAAAAGVVHRDVKPQNLFLARAPNGGATWKVLDFGVSKLASDGGTLTQGAPIGTPGYMAPEQARGAGVGPAADVFSLACIAYRALTGRPAFAGDDLPKILFDVCFAQPARPGELVSMPGDVERVLALGLAKKVEERFSSARDFAVALRDAFAEKLAPPLRARADALLVAAPWGSRPK